MAIKGGLGALRKLLFVEVEADQLARLRILAYREDAPHLPIFLTYTRPNQREPLHVLPNPTEMFLGTKDGLDSVAKVRWAPLVSLPELPLHEGSSLLQGSDRNLPR